MSFEAVRFIDWEFIWNMFS